MAEWRTVWIAEPYLYPLPPLINNPLNGKQAENHCTEGAEEEKKDFNVTPIYKHPPPIL